MTPPNIHTMFAQLRDVSQPATKTWVVSPEGRIKTAYAAEGVNHALVDAKGNVRPHLRELGWCLLAEAYEIDAQLGAFGFETFKEHQRQRKLGKTKDPLPDQYLPELVRERRKADDAASSWTPPPIPPKPKPTPAPVRDDDPTHVEPDDDTGDLPLPR